MRRIDMDEKRKGELGVFFTKATLRKKDIRLTPDLKHEVMEWATEGSTEIDGEEVVEFIKEIILELVEESLPKRLTPNAAKTKAFFDL